MYVHRFILHLRTTIKLNSRLLDRQQVPFRKWARCPSAPRGEREWSVSPSAGCPQNWRRNLRSKHDPGWGRRRARRGLWWERGIPSSRQSSSPDTRPVQKDRSVIRATQRSIFLYYHGGVRENQSLCIIIAKGFKLKLVHWDKAGQPRPVRVGKHTHFTFTIITFLLKGSFWLKAIYLAKKLRVQ